MLPVAYLDPRKPHPVRMLGKRYVAWWVDRGLTERLTKGARFGGCAERQATDAARPPPPPPLPRQLCRLQHPDLTRHTLVSPIPPKLTRRRFDRAAPDGGAWRLVDDMCPHRLSPLSESRIRADGRLT